MTQEQNVILVDDQDRETGISTKTEAHRDALLHRAVSVFIVNTKGEWLIQQRAFEKYHSAGQWSNTCCTHPKPGEGNREACIRRVHEEMGIGLNNLTSLFGFIYYAELEGGMHEHEYDHVYFGITDAIPDVNPKEVAGYRYLPYSALAEEMQQNPDQFTVWFRKICSDVEQHIKQLNAPL